MKTSIKILTIALSLGLAFVSNAQELVTHDFNNGDFFPYEVPKADQEARVKIINNRVETHWDESSYDGTNSGRKAQIKQAAGDHTDDELRFTQHIWMGFWLKIHSDYMKNNTNTNAGLMQIWGHSPNGAENHMCMLKFDGRNGGALVWQHRYNSVANKAHYLVYPNFPRDKFVRVVMHVKLAERDKGLVQVWVDDELKVDKSNQTIGWGDQNANGMINGTYAFGTSIGQYNYFENANYDDAYDGNNIWFDGHMKGETRTVTYDEVALYNGADGYDLVDPNGGSGTTTTPTPVTGASFTPDPNRTYYIDVPEHNLRLAATGNSEDAYTTSTNTTGDNVEWQFVDKGNGSWHIQLASDTSKPRLRTRNNGGETDMQETSSDGTWTYWDFTTGSLSNTYFFTLPDGPGDQTRLQVDREGDINMVTPSHDGTWESFRITEAGFVNGSGTVVHITKRNATGFALDGDNGGENGQNLYLWSANQNNENQQWIEIDRGNGYYSYQKMGTDFCIDGNGGGAEGQNVYLWACSDNNQNQHWKKVSTAGGSFRLEKRNSPSYSLDGNRGGEDEQNVYLWNSDSDNQNQQWLITPVGASTKSVATTVATDDVVVYPNPFVDVINVSVNDNKVIDKVTYKISDLAGRTLGRKVSKDKEQEFYINSLPSGIYLLEINTGTKIYIKKIVKK